MSNDPTSLFFPDSDGSVDLYSVLKVSSTATGDDIKTAYRKLALKHHPDKHAAASEEAKASASATFQQIGFAYAVLSDTARRKRYDATGSADPGIEDLAEGEDAWERYFQEMFDTVTRERLDEMRRAYQGSDEERSDLRAAYLAGNGSIEDIMDAIPHSTYEDEVRLVALVNDMIGAGELQQLPTWTAAIKNIKAQNARQKKGEKEAKEAEEAARELGVWDEFYGSGKVGKRKGKGKGATASNGDPEGEDHSALKALIQSKAKKMDGFLDSLAEKFYMRNSIKDYNYRDMAATCIFLATKVEECGRKLKDVATTVIFKTNGNLKPDTDLQALENSKEHKKWTENILVYEETLLDSLCFDLVVESPHACLATTFNASELGSGDYGLFSVMGITSSLDDNHSLDPVVLNAWGIAHDTLRIPICLFFNAKIIAAACFLISLVSCPDLSSSPEWTDFPSPFDRYLSTDPSTLDWLQRFSLGTSDIQQIADCTFIMLYFYKASEPNERVQSPIPYQQASFNLAAAQNARLSFLF
ncbi:hypothetical protein FRC09_020378 [Ceratobasidium sp. 395]|nr:hypothetical protein FRC09_020378 [Ceratobasidium sp. 395]